MRLKCTLSTHRFWVPGNLYEAMEAPLRSNSLMVADERNSVMNWFAKPYRHDSLGTHYQIQLRGEYGVRTLANFVIHDEPGF